MRRTRTALLLLCAFASVDSAADASPQITLPAAGATLSGSSQVFQWSAGAGASNFYLYLGSTPGANDLLNAALGNALTVTATGLPTDGRTIHATLWWHNGGWQKALTTYTAATSGGGGGGGGGSANPQITSPAAGATLSGSSQVFHWSAGTGASDFWLYLGSAPGTNDLLQVALGNALTVTATGLPTDGRTIYATLWWRSSGWQQAHTTYTAATSGGGGGGGGGGTTIPEILSPAPDATLTGSSQVFQWSAGTGASDFWLYLGSAAGANDLLQAAVGNALTVTATGLPTDGRMIYATLWWRRNGRWETAESRYTASTTARATELFVAAGGTGSGSSEAPFGTIQQALNIAQPGDLVTVRPGTYSESLATVRSGLAGQPIRLRAESGRGSVLVTWQGRVLSVQHAYLVVEGLVLDGQYGVSDTVKVGSAGNYFTLRDVEVRRSTADLIDLAAPSGVLIENSLIHHALNATNGRADAHGIVAGPVRGLTVRGTQIHTFSGDGLQVDPGRSSPGWSGVTIEDSWIWLEPLPAPANGFAAGTVPGENAVDTKSSPGLPRASMTIRNSTMWGFRNGLIGNMAALNLKENVEVTVDRVTIFDSEIAFRLRGPTASTPAGAWVTLTNAVVHDVTTAFRYENDIERLDIWNVTLGRNITRAFQPASSSMAGLDVRNMLSLLPLTAESAHASNMQVATSAFVDAAAHDYALAAGAPAIDAGDPIATVTTDRVGSPRPQGNGHDVGAYERPNP